MTLSELQPLIEPHLHAIEKLLPKEYRLTLLARHTDKSKFKDADILLTIDDLSQVITAIQSFSGVWQPIETAPKDGTVIDLWAPSGDRWSDCFWGKPVHECGEMGQHCDSDWHSAAPNWVFSMFNEFLHVPPTHWLPIPAGPNPVNPVNPV